MSKPYVDRGIIKYSPFDSLNGFADMISELKHRLGKQPKVMLLEDKLEEMNRCLKYALAHHKRIHIKYFADGYVFPFSGIISKLDADRKVIYIEQKRYDIENIVDLHLDIEE